MNTAICRTTGLTPYETIFGNINFFSQAISLSLLPLPFIDCNLFHFSVSMHHLFSFSALSSSGVRILSKYLHNVSQNLQSHLEISTMLCEIIHSHSSPQPSLQKKNLFFPIQTWVLFCFVFDPSLTFPVNTIFCPIWMVFPLEEQKQKKSHKILMCSPTTLLFIAFHLLSSHAMVQITSNNNSQIPSLQCFV